MRVFQLPQHVELVVNHFLVVFDVLLKDDLDGHLAGRALGFANDSIRACAKGSAELVSGSAKRAEKKHISQRRCHCKQTRVGEEGRGGPGQTLTFSHSCRAGRAAG